jgi:signal transduction histidine kinase
MVYRLRRHDGQYRWILDNGVPRYTPSGTFMGYIGSCVDITDRVRAEEERGALVDKLQDALRMREQFMSIASHELKTPLTSLRLGTQRLVRWTQAEPSEEGERLRRVGQTVCREVDRLAKLVDDMLDISRIAGGRLVLDRRETDLGRLTGDVVDRFSDELLRCGCTVELRADPGVVGRWDPFRVEQVVINLLTNAMKYGAGRPVSVSVWSQRGAAGLRVRDHGRGIAAPDHARIFQCFERAVPADEISGMGLGLYIVREIVNAHGGTVMVESSPGEGASFTVRLPLGK